METPPAPQLETLYDLATRVNMLPNLVPLSAKLSVSPNVVLVLDEVKADVEWIAEGTPRTTEGFREVRRRLGRKWEEKGMTAAEMCALMRMAKCCYYTVSHQEMAVNAYVASVRTAAGVNVNNHFLRTGQLARPSALRLWIEELAVYFLGDGARQRVDFTRH